MKAATAFSATGLVGSCLAPQLEGAAPRQPGPHKRLIGVQMAPFNLLHEGIENTLDLLQDKAAVNTIICYTHTYYGGSTNRPLRILAHDHGISPEGMLRGRMPEVWVKHRDRYFRDTLLKHEPVDSKWKHADRDLFREMVEPARQRGMRIYARFFDPKADNGVGKIANWEQATAVNLFGKMGGGPCWNNPHYREFVAATMRDMFENYKLDGLLSGAELGGPLSQLLYWGQVPDCFCKYCRQVATKAGLDFDRAREGYEELYKLIHGIEQGEKPPVDGVLTTILHIFQKYPEVPGWNYRFLTSGERYRGEINGLIKSINPKVDIGRHVDHQICTWDFIHRAATPYSTMARVDDFLRPSLYFHITGPRVRWFYLERLKKGTLSELPLDQSLALYYSLMGLDPSLNPKLDELNDRGFDPTNFVGRETRRCVAGCGDEARCVPAIGFDVPRWGGEVDWADMEPFPTEPEQVYQAVAAAAAGGADGVIAAREYDELRVPTLQAFGQAVRDKFTKG